VGSFDGGLVLIPSIYIISLASANQRRSYQDNQSERLGFKPIWHQATSINDIDDQFFIENAFSWQRPLSKIEVACFMSHLELWRIVASSNEPAIILEDDVMLSNNWFDEVKALSLAEGIDYICLETWGKKILGRGRSINDLTLRKLILNSAGAAAYLIWPSGAKILLERFSKHGMALTDAFINQTKGWSAWQLSPANAIQLNVSVDFGLKPPFDSPSLIAREKNLPPTPPSWKILFKMKVRRFMGEFVKFFIKATYFFRGTRYIVRYSDDAKKN
jgi:glycosyl transferase family 25